MALPSPSPLNAQSHIQRTFRHISPHSLHCSSSAFISRGLMKVPGESNVNLLAGLV